MGKRMIFSEIRDSRFVTMRRGGTLQDTDHHLLAIWAADFQGGKTWITFLRKKRR